MARGTLYVKVHTDERGNHFLAKDGCHSCYGRGYTGVDHTRKIMIACKCMKHSKLDIGWIILKGGANGK